MTASPMVAELTQIYSLPDTEIQPAIGDRKSERRPHKDRLGMGRHIVRPLVGVQEIRRVFRHKPVKNRLEIVAHIRIGILVQSKSRRSMLDHQVKKSFLGQLRKLPHHLAGHEMYPTPVGTECKLNLLYHCFLIYFAKIMLICEIWELFVSLHS